MAYVIVHPVACGCKMVTDKELISAEKLYVLTPLLH